MTEEEKKDLATHVMNAGRGGNVHGMSHAMKFVSKIEKIMDKKIEEALKVKASQEDTYQSNSPALPTWYLGRGIYNG